MACWERKALKGFESFGRALSGFRETLALVADQLALEKPLVLLWGTHNGGQSNLFLPVHPFRQWEASLRGAVRVPGTSG